MNKMRVVIVGGGISGLSLAYFLLEKNKDLDIVVIESEKKAGGKIWTEKVNGFLCEGGVNGFLDNRPKTLELASKLSLKPLRSNDSARKRYIFSNGKLNLLPESPVSFLRSNLLSFSGRLRVLAEVFVPKRMDDDETLAQFAIRRLGRDAYEKLIDPMASGIFAGDPEKMSLRSCFPKVYNLEQTYGSLIKGMIRLKRQARKTGQKVGAGPGGVLTSFYDGMGTMINALTMFLGDRLKYDNRVVSIDKVNNLYNIYLKDGSFIESDVVVIASPAYEAGKILGSLNKEISLLLGDIFYPSITVVCFGYKKERIKYPLNGFGFLIPYKEKRKILGTLWDSSIFPNRAPDDMVLMRSMIGGARNSGLALMEEDKIVDIVINELRDIMDINVTPDFVKIYRHEKGIPQYHVGHERRLSRIEELLSKFKGLYLTGNAYRGIGVNDCIENSFKLAERIAKDI
jgi:oxygen-dependent protoporphyrinogen oxidase